MSDSPYIFEGTPDNFNDLVIEGSHEVPVLVDFWAEWCNPCQMLLPIVTALAEAYQGQFRLVKVNSDEQQQLAAQFGVRSLPTLKLFRNGEIVEDITGAQPESVLREILDKYITRESDQLLIQAVELAQQGDIDQARSLLEKAHSEDPDNPRIPLDLARLTVMAGDHTAAKEIITSLPIEQRESPDTKMVLAQIYFAEILEKSPEPDALVENIDKAPDDLKSRQQLAAWRALGGHHEIALELFLEIIKKDSGWEDNAGKTGLLAMFELLGGEGELVSRYRRQMFNLLH